MQRGGLVMTVREAGRDESRREKAEGTVNPVSRDVAADERAGFPPGTLWTQSQCGRVYMKDGEQYMNNNITERDAEGTDATRNDARQVRCQNMSFWSSSCISLQHSSYVSR